MPLPTNVPHRSRCSAGPIQPGIGNGLGRRRQCELRDPVELSHARRVEERRTVELRQRADREIEVDAHRGGSNRRTPERPSARLRASASIELPMGETTPSPVTATRRRVTS